VKLTTPTSNYDPNNPTAVTTPATVDPNLKNDITDELIIGFDHELMRNFGVGISFIGRKYHQSQGTYRSDPADISAAYVPVTFTVTCGNPATCGTQTFTGTYYQRSTALHAATIRRNDSRYGALQGPRADGPQAVLRPVDADGQLRSQQPDPLRADGRPRLSRSDQSRLHRRIRERLAQWQECG
jgi:hypothetical protein